jgi:hypothetical protein
MALPEPQSVTFSSLFAEIENGTIKIPQFQRDFVWSKARSALLLDSIVRGYPIGTFILWKTNERLRAIRNIGNLLLPDTQAGDAVKYVLDGQQRLTSLFVTLKGLSITREEQIDDYSNFWLRLDGDEEEPVVSTEAPCAGDQLHIRLRDLLAGDFAYLASFAPAQQELIRTYKNRIESYQFSTILITGAPIEVATEIFTRLNVGGEPLSVFEIMVAKTYDPVSNFDLAERYNELSASLSEADYGTISPATILQAVSVLIKGQCRKKDILSLRKQDVIAIWPALIESVEHAVDYLRNYYRIPVSKLLPYPAQIIPLTYFFYKNGSKLTGDRQKFMHDFFWRVALSGRYSQSLETRIAQDIEKIDLILNEKLPTYDWAIDVSVEFIRNNGFFSASRSFIKAILCLFAYQQPKSFADDSIVRLDNAFLKQANSKNYHHFFPKAWLEKQGEDFRRINHIANITLVDDFLNKRVIGARPPSLYMKKFIKENSDIASSMATHLIKLDEKFGVLNDDYSAFFEARCRAISARLAKQIIPQEIDGQEEATPANQTVVELDEASE